MTTEEVDVEPLPKDTQSGESVSTCMICMEEWTIGSEHRICCLKCGHLFGRSCIERWLKEKGSNNAKCPTCNKPAKKADLRDLWCKTINATDATELERIQERLELEQKARKTDSAVIFHQNIRLEMLIKDIENLKKVINERDSKIAKLENILDRYNKLRAKKIASAGENDLVEFEMPDLQSDNNIDVDIQPFELKGSFHWMQNVESSSTGGCRSFALCPTSSIILVAQPAPQGTRNIFGGFGLRKYSTIDFSVREYIPLHSKMITSIQLKPVGDLILTSSQDKKVRITSISNNTCVQSYQCQYEPTCVSWSAHRDQQFYVASGNCFVTLFDLRNTSDCIYQTNRRIANTRILSVSSTTDDGLNGLVVNDSKGSQFLEVSDESAYVQEEIDQSVEHLTSHQLPFEGLMGTVDYDKRLNVALITTRRSTVSPNCSHNLVKLEKVYNEDGSTQVECKQVKTFMGGSPGELLSQSRILRHPTLNDSILVGACDQDANGIKLWDSSDNSLYQTIKTNNFIRDMAMYSPMNSNQHVLYTLSEKGLGIYRWDYA